MARRTRQGNPKELRTRLANLLENFEQRLEDDDLREQVRSLVPAVHLLRDLGSSLLPITNPSSARDRILYYLERYEFTIIAGDELGVVSGISEYARRVRELRVEYGWPIYSGATAKAMIEEEPVNKTKELFGSDLRAKAIRAMKTDDYVLVGEQDRDAAHRWNVAKEIRGLAKNGVSVRDRILRYLRKNVAHPVTGEELRYVASGATEWGRRTRELRTEWGWPVVTRNSGRPDLPVGVYILEADRQSEPHDRNIPDSVRIAILERDGFKCQCCDWEPTSRKQGDPRTLLELHHIKHHAKGGSNDKDNLASLCNVHHDDVHRLKLNGKASFAEWLESECS